MNWKAYDEVHFSDQYILRWVREGDEYVNRISKEMMEDLHAVVRQQQAEIEALKKEAALQRLSDFTQEAEKTLTDEEIYKIANSIETIQPQHGLRLSNDLNVMEFARAILRKAQEK